jgi:RNase P subunit RPR2
MPLTSGGRSSLEMTHGRPLCPKCRAPLWIIRIEREKIANDKRAFQCPRCEHSHVEAISPEQPARLAN